MCYSQLHVFWFCVRFGQFFSHIMMWPLLFASWQKQVFSWRGSIIDLFLSSGWYGAWYESNHVIISIWVASSEFVSSSIPSWQILIVHAQSFRGVRDLAFCLKVPLDSLLVWASSEGSGETARMRRLAWTFAARIGDKYQIRFTRPIYRFVGKIFNLGRYQAKSKGQAESKGNHTTLNLTVWGNCFT